MGEFNYKDYLKNNPLTKSNKESLNESAPGFENRKFGEPLPTLDSVREEYEASQAEEGSEEESEKESGEKEVEVTINMDEVVGKKGADSEVDDDISAGVFTELPPKNENIDYSNLKLFSDIDETWANTDVMEADLLDWFNASVAAAGLESGEEILNAIDRVRNKMDQSLDTTNY